MKLTEEMKTMAIESGQICTVFNNDYILLYKPFTCKKEKIDEYIAKIDKLKELGIKTAGILDYYPAARVNTDYPTCVILEEKAPGKNIEPENENISLNKTEINFEEISARYIQRLDYYINEISLRASASQEIYNKFIDDFITITNEGLQIDPKPLNFFFDPNAGFTFIDINAGGKTDYNYLPRYILGGVLGYGLPSLSINYQKCMYIDEDRLKKLRDAINAIIQKVIISLKRLGYSEESIQKDSLNWTSQLNNFSLINDLSNLSIKLSEDYAHILEAEKEKQKESKTESDWTIGW